MICAGNGPILSGCHGDSGGPYVCPNSAGRYVLQGAVSWGSPRCSAAERYTVFARVAEFRSWIDGKIGGTVIMHGDGDGDDNKEFFVVDDDNE